MKKIDAIVSELNPSNVQEHEKPRLHGEFSDKDYRIVNKLFVTFQSIFPAFKQAWPSEFEFETAKREWIKAFKQVNLTDVNLIKIGVERFRLLPCPFVPSPGQFIAMCNPNAEDYGLKSPNLAFLEACEQSHPSASKIFSHVTIKLARDLTGVFFLISNPRSKSYPIFEKNYNNCVRMFLEGKNLNQLEVDTGLKKQELKEPKDIEKFRHLRDSQSAIGKMMEMLGK